MKQVLVIRFGQADTLGQGCSNITIDLRDTNNHSLLEENCSLQPNEGLRTLYQQWQLFHQSYYNSRFYMPRGAAIDDDDDGPDFIQAAGITNISIKSGDQLNQLGNNLVKMFNQWLCDEPFRAVIDQVRWHLNRDVMLHVVIKTDSEDLQKLPWEHWKLVEDYPKAGVVRSPLTGVRIEQTDLPNERVALLGILGDDSGIDTQTDRTEIEQIAAIASEFLKKPTEAEFRDRLWSQRWQILFFAGHSSSSKQGYIKLNSGKDLSLDELEQTLRRSIHQGLQLAIFNSCDGLKLANQLANLNLPAIILMREPVPNGVAQRFLRYFLEEFSQALPLDVAVIEAQRRLQDEKTEFPGAALLPTLLKNPTSELPTWQALQRQPEASHIAAPPVTLRRRSRRVSLRAAFAISLLVTGFVMGVRIQGYLQPLELKAFDHLMRQRPVEGPDPRLTVVEITDADVQAQSRRNEPGEGSLRDPTLQKLLAVLDKYQPGAIGIDIIREKPVTPGYKSLALRLGNSRLPVFGICQHPSDTEPVQQGVPHPPAISTTQIGFNNFWFDDDNVSRRYSLFQESSASPCQASEAFGLQLALYYLKLQRIERTEPTSGILKIDKVVFPPIKSNSGGYQTLETLPPSLYLTLLNYRPYNSLDQIATRLTLQQVLNEQFNPKAVQNKIILIGRVDNDPFTTPYNAEQAWLTTPGVYMHAQAISQILSAVLDGRPLLRWLPLWGDIFWIWIWAGVGGALTWRMMTTETRWFALVGWISGAAIALYMFCWLGILQAYWLPLIPAEMALGFTSLGTVAWVSIRKQRLEQT